jgi:hypothetical protein
MLPKILTVVADCYGNSRKLQELRKHPFILFASPSQIDGPPPGLTLVYGYALAKQLFENVSIGDYYIDDNTRWTFNEFESKDDVYIDEWIDTSLDTFFSYTPLEGKFDEDELKQQLDATDLVFLYIGNHELYLYDGGKSECISWTAEELSYRLDTTLDAFAARITNYLFSQKRAVYAWDPANLKTVDHTYDNIPIFIRDLAYASMDVWLMKRHVKEFVATKRELTTPEFMKYLAHMPEIYTQIEQKDYLRRYMAGECEQLFSRAQIYFDRDKLLALIKQRNKAGADARVATKIYNELGSDGMVQIPYLSRNKVTGRLFPHHGIFNPITESDPEILACIASRHNGAVVVFDYAAFEPTIIHHVTKVAATPDIHDRAAQVLITSRDNAKKLNNMILYGASAKALMAEMKAQEISPEASDRYLQMMTPTIKAIDEIDGILKQEYDRLGFIRNALGRIVRPRQRSGVFNNFVQSTASDLFNTASLHVFELLRDKKSELFMHKFDALYVDVHPDETEVIEDIVSAMAGKTGVRFTVKVLAGRDLGNLRVLQ